MTDSSGDERDSRTASVGLQRPRASGSSGASRASSQDRSIGKGRPRKGAPAGQQDVRDFVPQGSKFSTIPLDVDPASTSSSASDASSSSEGSGSEDTKAQGTQQLLGSATPAINWNKGGKTAIRTTLGGRVSKPGRNTPASGFDSVNKKYWRSRSASASTAEEDGDATTSLPDPNGKGNAAEEEVKNNGAVLPGSGPYFAHSDDSDSGEVSEGDDSIMLNIGTRNGRRGVSETQDDGNPSKEGMFQFDSHPSPVIVNGAANEPTPPDLRDAETGSKVIGASSAGRSKEDTFRAFSRKYATPPSILADLPVKDFKTQVKYLFYNRDIHDIDLALPIACTECFQEGHLAEVCPSKECEHCGAWDQHESNFCPSWRRCQKCRERGHDASTCSSALKGTAAEVPCDFCGSENHLELDCDIMWKFPQRNPSPGPVLVSLSCCHCTSNRHLVGDCPSLPRPMKSSSWTLKGYDPSMITNINAVVPSQRGGTTITERQGGMRIRGRADPRSPSPDSDDMLARPDRRNPVNRNQARPNIRFGNGIGRDRDLSGPQDSRRPGFDSRGTYRDRRDYPGYNTRQRSLSPDPYPIPGRDSRMKDSWQPPPPRSPPRGRGRAPPPRRGRGGGPDRGNRGGGRGAANRRPTNGDAYRPMPSAAKRAWDRSRF